MKSATSFEEKLKRIFLAAEVTSDSALARILNIKPPSIGAAKKRRQIPTGWVEHVAEKFGVSSDWLFFGVGSMKRGEDAPSYGENAYRQAAGHDFGLALIKKVKARLSAGTGSLETEGDIKGFYSFREDWIHGKGNPGNMVLMDVYGTSMEPEIRDGDTVLIDESQKEIYAGRVYAVGVDDEVLIKYIDKAPGKIVLRSKNVDEYPPIEIDLSEEHQSFRIIGRVIWWCREAR